MSARDPLNLRHWVGWGIKKAGKQGYRRKIWIVAKNCKWRHYCEWPEGVPNISKAISGGRVMHRSRTYCITYTVLLCCFIHSMSYHCTKFIQCSADCRWWVFWYRVCEGQPRAVGFQRESASVQRWNTRSSRPGSHWRSKSLVFMV